MKESASLTFTLHQNIIHLRHNMNNRISLKHLLLEFLKIGAISFGGGISVIAIIERELIKKREVISIEEFLHGIGLGQILGPFAVNISVFIGYRIYGILGGILCTTCFMLPSLSLVVFLSYLYFKFHSVPSLQAVSKGIGPVVIALILSVGWSMGKKAIKSKLALFITIISMLFALIKVNTLIILLLAGAIGILIGLRTKISAEETKIINKNRNLLLLPFSFLTGANLTTPIFLAITFFKIGLVFFGGGFVLIPVLHQQLVEHLGWLTQKEFIDGVAISTLTPGPIAVLATFAGFKVYGLIGAFISTFFLLLPSIILMLIISKSYQHFRDWFLFQSFLSGVMPAVIGLILNACIVLSMGLPNKISAYTLLITSFLLLTRFKLHPEIVLAIGAIAGITGIL